MPSMPQHRAYSQAGVDPGDFGRFPPWRRTVSTSTRGKYFSSCRAQYETWQLLVPVSELRRGCRHQQIPTDFKHTSRARLPILSFGRAQRPQRSHFALEIRLS